MFTMNHLIQDKLQNLLSRPGYTLVQKHGQRIFQYCVGNFTPPRGSEVFVGKLPKNLFEDELVPVFEQIGQIFRLRLMLDFNGRSRGFAFVTFFNSEIASTAISMLQNYPIRPGKYIGVYKSLDNCRLFVGSIPTYVTKDMLYKELMTFVEGIKEVIMYPSHKDRTQNRGFAFIEFETHRLAAIARRKLSPGSVNLWGSDIMVDWADPIPDPDPAIMAQVTKLYIRNLPLKMTNQELYDILHHVNLQIAYVCKVHKHDDYAFVHFTTRATAEEALIKLSGLFIGGQKIEVTWARPRMYSKEYRLNTPPDNFCLSLPPKMRKKVVEKNLAFKKLRNVQLPSPSPIYSHFANSDIFMRNEPKPHC